MPVFGNWQICINLLPATTANASGDSLFRLRIGIGAARGGGVLINLHHAIAFFLPFLDQVAQGMVADDDFGWKDHSSQQTHSVADEPALDISSLIAVAIST